MDKTTSTAVSLGPIRTRYQTAVQESRDAQAAYLAAKEALKIATTTALATAAFADAAYDRAVAAAKEELEAAKELGE